MPIGQYHYDGLIQALHEIRDEMRSLRAEMQVFLAQPQSIILNGNDLAGPSKEELEKQLDEYFGDQKRGSQHYH